MRKWEVDLTLIEAWIDSLDDEEYDNVIAALEQLEEHGPVTRRPSWTPSRDQSTRT
ncbi:hypothetical protein [Mycobacterium simulans]